MDSIQSTHKLVRYLPFYQLNTKTFQRIIHSNVLFGVLIFKANYLFEL